MHEVWWCPLGALGGAFRGFFGLLGASLGHLGGLLGASWGPLGSSLEAFGRVLGGSGGKIGVEHCYGRFPFSGRAVLEASWGRFSSFWRSFWIRF